MTKKKTKKKSKENNKNKKKWRRNKKIIANQKESRKTKGMQLTEIKTKYKKKLKRNIRPL